MRQQFNKIQAILDRQDWLALLVAMLLLVVTTFLESVGLFSIFPFMKMATNPEIIDSNAWLAYAKSSLGFSSNHNFLIASGFAMLATFVSTTIASVYAAWMTYRSIWLLAHRLGVRLLDRYSRLPFEFYHRNNSAEFSEPTKSLCVSRNADLGKPLVVDGVVCDLRGCILLDAPTASSNFG